MSDQPDNQPDPISMTLTFTVRVPDGVYYPWYITEKIDPIRVELEKMAHPSCGHVVERLYHEMAVVSLIKNALTGLGIEVHQCL